MARRVSKVSAGVLMAGSALLVSPPSMAAEPRPQLVDAAEAPDPIAPGASGTAVVGLRNVGHVDARNDGQMYMELWAPRYSYFTAPTLTPVGDAPGGWSCKGDAAVEGRPYKSTILKCSSDKKGVVAAAREAVRWKVQMSVSPQAPADTVLHNAGEDGYGAVLYHSTNGRGTWSNMSLQIYTQDA
ncbi:hypothetical protein ACFUV1_08605 [Streptomyces griseoincarnatus]